ncbi:MAG: glycoside hydrolase family 25 protein [Microgenomates group bacterium]
MNITKEVEFPDISFWQGNVDFAKMSSKTKNIILRAGQGNFIDSKFERNRSEAKKYGMNWGMYWFFDGRYSPKSQIEAIARLIRQNDNIPNVGLWIDWERNYSGNYEGIKNVIAVMEGIEEEFPYMKVGIYTGYYFFIGNTNRILNYYQLQYLKNKPLWLASYTDYPQYVKVPFPWTNDTVTVWQWGTPPLGKEYGCEDSVEIDMNWWTKSKEEFEQFIGKSNSNTNVGEKYVQIESISLRLENGVKREFIKK